MKTLKATSVLMIVLLSGCSAMEYPTPRASDLVNAHILTTTSGQGQIYVLAKNNNHYLCSLPKPDSTFNQKESGGLNVSLINTQGESTDISEGSNENELTGRTPTVLMTRELFFRACEFSTNFQLNKDEAKQLYLKTLDGVLANWAIEAKQTTVNISDSNEKAANTTQPNETSSNTTTPDSTTTSTGVGSY